MQQTSATACFRTLCAASVHVVVGAHPWHRRLDVCLTTRLGGSAPGAAAAPAAPPPRGVRSTVPVLLDSVAVAAALRWEVAVNCPTSAKCCFMSVASTISITCGNEGNKQ